MSELSFLLELLLNHKLTKETKALITQRISEVEKKLSPYKDPHIGQTTQEKLAQAQVMPIQGTTPAAMQALHDRQIAMGGDHGAFKKHKTN